jgi:glycosyltransferase involved in cell wall biosynthesis
MRASTRLFVPRRADAVASVTAQYTPDCPYLLMVGTLEPRKNHAAALHALAQLKREGLPHRLVIAGGQRLAF